MQNRVLLDTSFLFALNDPTDRHYVHAVRFLTYNDSLQVIAQVVLTEAAFMLERHAGERALFRFWNSLDSPLLQFELLSVSDLMRAKDIRLHYADARFDFVDCCLMALAERLNVTQICTFDRRDFVIFRPSHCEHLELLP